MPQREWPAVAKWTPTYLAKIVGTEEDVTLQSGVQEQEDTPFVATSFDTFAEWLEEGSEWLEEEEDERNGETKSSLYIAEEFDFLERHRALLDDLELENFYNFFEENGAGKAIGMDGFETAFWMGGAGSKTGLHIDHDFPLNLLVHLKGEKTVWIAGPWENEKMYPSQKFDPGGVLSSVNFWEPDLQRFPLYALASFDKVRLLPGDMLFIPAGFWHAAIVERGPAVSVSVRSMSTLHWILNWPDRLLEYLHELGVYWPAEGSVTHSRTTEWYENL